MRLIRKRILLKSFAVFFILEMVTSTVAPAISWALTSGPTAPEATSFEPVDTTDMVDVKTGDFTYNTPLLEVPGPGGSYPLSLSYHAGIPLTLESSWVGLGFSINPGSVSRMVSGYPDDHLGISNVSREFWEGGRTETFTVGISVGIDAVASVSAKLVYGDDTYRGSGVGFEGGFNMMGTGNFSIGASGGVGPFGQSYSQVSLGRGSIGGGNSGSAMTGSIGISLNSAGDVGLSAGVSSYGMSIMDVSISSQGLKPSLSISYVPNFIHQHNRGKESQRSHSWDVDIPLYFFNFKLGQSYRRYWIDEKDHAFTYGSLYFGESNPGFDKAYDTYDLLDTQLDIVTHNNAEKVLGGSFPDVDSYMVTGQGIGGSIQPFHYQQELYGQNKKNKSKTVLSKTYPLAETSHKDIGFRFLNDFSNRFEYDPGEFNVNTGLSFEFDNNYVTGENGDEGFSNNRLVGSRNVEWFTNRSIISREAINIGFIDTNSGGLARSADDQIGGFSITSSDGVTYHYALPAYSYDETMKYRNTVKEAQENGLYYNKVDKPARYAYTWFLTAVTGADFVDKNSNGLADKGDWGYWVTFEYEKWLNDYKWRNPGEDFHKDLDTDFDFYSSGKKEIYYLEKVITDSHVAIFEKSVRMDSREVMDAEKGGFEPVSYVKTAGRERCKDDCENRYCTQGNCQEAYTACDQGCDLLPPDEIAYTFPKSLQKLDRIKLFNFVDYQSGKLTDEFVLRSILFEYDYSLVKETPNSYDESHPETKLGKLTLKSLRFNGKGNLSIIPKTNFHYAKNPDYQKGHYDMWSYYKNDYEESTNENLSRLTSPQSAIDVDAWSLTSVELPLGSVIKIQYESDTYTTPLLYRNNLLTINSLERNQEAGSFILNVNSGVDLREYISLIKQSELIILMRKWISLNDGCVCDGVNYAFGGTIGNYYSQFAINMTNDNIVNITANSIEFLNSDLGEYFDYTVEERYEKECTYMNAGTEHPYITINEDARFVGGNLILRDGILLSGGGLRVKQLTLSNLTEELTTNYEYYEGVTTYEPVNFGKVYLDYSDWDKLGNKSEKKRTKEAGENYKRAAYSNFHNLLSISRILPGPGVMYGKTRVRQSTKTPDGNTHVHPNYTEYEIEVFNNGMIGVEYTPVSSVSGDFEYEDSELDDPIKYKRINTRKVALKDYTARIGNLKSVTQYTTGGNVVSRTTNMYLHDGLAETYESNKDGYEPLLESQVKNQGMIDQTFSRARLIHYKKNDEKPYLVGSESGKFEKDTRHLLGVLSKLERFPSIKVGQKNENVLTGITSSSEYLESDFYSGEITKILSTDSYGNRFLSVSTPAYKVYPSMGSKANDPNNRNMLLQTVAQKSFLVNGDNEPTGLLSASVQIWSNDVDVRIGDEREIKQSDIWRKKAAYVWNGEQDLVAGVYPYDGFVDFDWSAGAENAQWLKTNEITLYGVNSSILEDVDVNGNYSSTKLNYSQTKIVAAASNARYSETAYSGAEYYFENTLADGGVSKGSGNPSRGHAHTGTFSLLVPQASEGFNYTLSAQTTDLKKKYRASVWVYAPGDAETQSDLNNLEIYYIINGHKMASVHPTLQKNKSKSWYLMNIDITPDGNNDVSIFVRNGTQRGVYFDDFRVHPINSDFTSYVYDPFSGELTHILDADNFYSEFKYDAMGRLIQTSRELLNFDFGDGKESYKADQVTGQFMYNFGKSN